jgi:uncharacterized protein YgiM (DUF1202 family)
MKLNWVKRLVCVTLALMMMTVAIMPALAVGHSSTLAKKGDNYIVIAKGLNVRSGAGTNYSIITSIKKGTKVVFQKEKNGWWYIQYPKNKYGYVDKQYLTRSNVSKTGTYKTTSNLNVRSFPRTDAGIYGSYKKNTKIKVLQLNGDWCRVNYNGKEGWVASKYLKK